jgi:hypothetical protein
MSVKLPKQWKHWCRKAGLRPEYVHTRYNRESWTWQSLNGNGRKWRIALRDVRDRNDCIFQAGDLYDDFDRWALSERRNFEIPKSWAEFKAAVDSVRGLQNLG